MVTGDLHTDVCTLLDNEWSARATMYAQLQDWPAEYRREIFTLYDELVAAEQFRVRKELGCGVKA